MKKSVMLGSALLMVLGLAQMASAQADQPVLVVNKFTLGANVAWPYDLPAMQRKIIDAAQKKFGTKVVVADKAPDGATKVYTLDGVVTKNFTQRDTDSGANVSSEIEVGEIQVTLTGPDGKKWIDNKKKQFQTGHDPQAVPDKASAGPLGGQISSDIVGQIAGSKAFGN